MKVITIQVTADDIKRDNEQDNYPRVECTIRGSLIEDYPVFEIVTRKDNRVIFTGTDAQITEFIGSDVWAIGDVIFW